MNNNLEETIDILLKKLEKTFTDEDKEFNRRMNDIRKQIENKNS